MSAPREYAGFFGETHRPLFGVLHEPAPEAPPRGAAWLLCAPFGEERANAHRMLVCWARRLAAAGHWVFRFDYRGTGDSAGRFEHYTLDDHLLDIMQAAAALQARCAVAQLGLCGLRLGGTLAALAASRMMAPMRLMLWEPVADGAAYAESLLRIVMSKQLADSGRAPMRREALRARIAAGEGVAVQGHLLREELLGQIERIDLPAWGRPTEGGIFLARLLPMHGCAPDPALDRLRETYAARGPLAWCEARVPHRPWTAAREYGPAPAALFDPALAWAADAAPPARPATAPKAHPWGMYRAGPAAGPALPAARWHNHDHEERVVHLDVCGARVDGILYVPHPAPPGRPAVVLLPIAYHARTANAAFNPRLARALAARGWMSLAIDARGSGDSEGELAFPAVPELYRAVQEGLHRAEVRAAFDYLERALEAPSVIPCGICGGAIDAVYAAAEDPRAAGLIPLETVLDYARTKERGGAAPADGAVAAAANRNRSAAVRAWLARHPRTRTALRTVWYGLRRHAPAPRAAAAPDARSNAPLLAALEACARRGLPMLSVFGGAHVGLAFAFDGLLPGLRRAGGAGILNERIPGADHLFSQPEHAAQLIDRIAAWLEDPGQPWAARPASRPGESRPAVTSAR